MDQYPGDRLVSEQEAERMGEILKLEQQEAESLSFMNAGKSLGKIAYFTP